MIWTRRRVVVSLALFLGLLVAGAWPWPAIQRGFAAIYCPVANLVIAPQTFGQGGHARLRPLPRIVRQPTDNVTADTALALSVAGYDGDLAMGMSVRRDACLPLWILTALLIAAPLPFARRMKALAIGIPLMLALNLAALELLVTWTFAFQLRGIYPPDAGAVWRRLIDLAYGAVLTPPGNRFIAPLAIGAALIVWLRGARAPARPSEPGLVAMSP
jgi:hypothetical protein